MIAKLFSEMKQLFFTSLARELSRFKEKDSLRITE